MAPGEKILFDPKKIRFDLPLFKAFRLTKVGSIEDYRSLMGSLADLRGMSYFFINCLESRARLMITIIAADREAVTTSFTLDHDLLGIRYEDLLSAIIGGSGNSGNYPLPPEIERKLRDAALNDNNWRFFKAE